MASIPQPSEASGVKTVSTSFSLDVQNDCIQTALIDKAINDMTVKVSLSSTQDITFQDTKANVRSIPAYCGPRVVTFSGGIPAYLSLDA
jgi:hypothetical protein